MASTATAFLTKPAAAVSSVPTVQSFGELSTDAQLSAANVFFGIFSYIKGATLTTDDHKLVKKLAVAPSKYDYPNLYRWFVHINYIGDEVAMSSLKPPAKAEEAVAKLPHTNIAEVNTCKIQTNAAETQKATPKPAADEDDDFDVFGDDGADAAAEAKKLTETRAEQKKKEEAPPAAKSKKQVIGKSSLVIEVTPASGEVNLDKLWEMISAIKINGLTWGESFQKIPFAFSLYKLRCSCTIIDDLVETDFILQEIEVLGLSEEKAKERRVKRDAGDDDDEDDEEEEALVQTAQILSFNKL